MVAHELLGAPMVLAPLTTTSMPEEVVWLHHPPPLALRSARRSRPRRKPGASDLPAISSTPSAQMTIHSAGATTPCTSSPSETRSASSTTSASELPRSQSSSSTSTPTTPPPRGSTANAAPVNPVGPSAGPVCSSRPTSAPSSQTLSMRFTAAPVSQWSPIDDSLVSDDPARPDFPRCCLFAAP